MSEPRTLATLFSSDPPDGTHLVAWHGTTPTVIWRNDRDAVDGRRWFDQASRDLGPSTLAEYLTGADDVMLLVKLDQAGRREVDAVFARVVT